MSDNEIVSKLNILILNESKKYNGLYFFGSRLKNVNNKDSDYDIVALFKQKLNEEEKDRIYRIIGNMEYQYNIFIDIKLLNENDFSKNYFFYNEVINSGVYYGK